MCTLVALLRTVPGYPLVVAMNRDEYYDRPSLPPELRQGPAEIVAPRDARAEGTWIGVNRQGVVAALSNRFGGAAGPNARSRGLLCLESLTSASAGEAAMFSGEAPDRHKYNGFNLLHADARQLVCTSHDKGTWAVHGRTGLNVLTNAGLNADDPRALRVHELLRESSFEELDLAVDAMRRALADHEDRGGRAICHHGEKTGTRSQTILALDDAGWRHYRLWYAEGYPCTAKAVDLSDRFR
jgi:uncharacterized protein with NRDE domain